ncbi:DUF4435 domain-containing protein [Sulfitobacter faviae]|uniref:DUF4435 domain-containing protein n=1 Tax=Sulfitobacter faviae TaxID=1775881 RepID=A0AAX3LKX7_9RHOB|nr:DUF4435 domain-containing protein [Sulfitobacter faviae]WCE69225.1 DUF4435 domain-containing protein [Sulfitobacter faviae]
MTFERTKSGQQNRAAFLGVDYVCYVEGGGGFSDFSDDVVFWQTVLEVLRPDLKIHFLARGGKPELEARARDIISKGIDHALVAMDSDFDELLNDKINDRRVLYTHGYSWENDIFPKQMLAILYAHKIRASSPPAAEVAELSNKYDEMSTRIRWPVRADYYAFVAKSSVLPRNAPGRVISKCRITGYPLVMQTELRKLCRQANSGTQARTLPNLTKLAEPMRYCAGKVYAHLVHLLVTGVLRAFSRNASLTPVHLIDMALLKMPEYLRRNNTDSVVMFHAGQAALI